MRATRERCPPSPHASPRLEPSHRKQKSLPMNAAPSHKFPFLRTKSVRCEDTPTSLFVTRVLGLNAYFLLNAGPNFSLNDLHPALNSAARAHVKITGRHWNMQCWGRNYKTIKTKRRLRGDIFQNIFFCLAAVSQIWMQKVKTDKFAMQLLICYSLSSNPLLEAFIYNAFS